jgi:hypothetical protein
MEARWTFSYASIAAKVTRCGSRARAHAPHAMGQSSGFRVMPDMTEPEQAYSPPQASPALRIRGKPRADKIRFSSRGAAVTALARIICKPDPARELSSRARSDQGGTTQKKHRLGVTHDSTRASCPSFPGRGTSEVEQCMREFTDVCSSRQPAASTRQRRGAYPLIQEGLAMPQARAQRLQRYSMADGSSLSLAFRKTHRLVE